MRPCFGIASWHDRWTEASTFFATGNAGADEENPFGGQILCAAVRIGEQGIAAVDDDVSFRQERQQVIDHLIDGVAGFHHQHDAAWTFQQPDQLLDGVSADDVGAFGFVGEEVVDLGDGAVEDGHFEAVVIHVENEVLTHYGKADQADVTRGVWHTCSNWGTSPCILRFSIRINQ